VSYQIIAELRGLCALETMCRALGVSVSGYYAWSQRPASAHQLRDEALLDRIRVIHSYSHGLYGSPRIHAALQQHGIMCSRKRVARLMHQAGIHSLRAVRRRIRTTDSQHRRPVAPNLLQRDFSATVPNEKWVGDMLGIWTDEGYLYLAALLDTYSRLVVGFAMSAWRDEALVTGALRMALGRRIVAEDLIHHTDQGSQYTADDYLALLAAHGISVSMSRKGDCYDNAMMESFFSTLRAECTERQRYRSRAEARTSVFEYIEVFYNRQRLHSSLGYRCPADYEAAERQEVS